MPKLNETQEDILNNFISDDEDQDQLGNEPELDDDEDEDGSPTGDVADDDDDDDGDDKVAARRGKAADDGGDEEGAKQDRFAFKEDRAGNFIDRDGKVIIRAGKQRDLFVKLKKRWLDEEKKHKALAGQFGQTVEAARSLLDRYKALKADKSYFDDKGLSKDEIRQAADLAVLMKVDPKAGVRKILTMLHMGGTDLKDIGVTGPVDAAEVARIIEQRSRPKEKTQEELARDEANAFLNRHPGARPHTGIVAQAKRRFPHMSLDEIWFQLQLHAQKRQSEGNGKSREPDKVSPRNGTRGKDEVKKKTRLSLNAVDPSQSFSQIGRDLLRDLQSVEGKM